MRLPRKPFTRIAAVNLDLRKRLGINEGFLRFMGKGALSRQFLRIVLVRGVRERSKRGFHLRCHLSWSSCYTLVQRTLIRQAIVAFRLRFRRWATRGSRCLARSKL